MLRKVSSIFLSAVTLLVLAAVPAGAGAAEPSVSVLNSEPLKVSGTKGSDTAEAKFSVLNSGQTDLPVKVTFQAASSERVAVEKIEPEEIPAGKAVRLTVTLAGLEDIGEAVTGQLVVSGGAQPVAQSIEVDPPSPDEGWPTILIGGSFAVAVLFALFVLGSLGEDRGNLGKRAPNPKWSFSSWATTLTAVGAASATVLSGVTFPSVPANIGKPELTNLNILFALILLVGPFLFETLRRFNVDPEEAKAERTGSNWTLLLASTFTLWAVVGQIGALGLLGWELLGNKASAWGAAVAAALAIALAAWYFFTTVSELVIRDWAKEEAEAKKKEEEEGNVCRETRHHSWHLL